MKRNKRALKPFLTIVSLTISSCTYNQNSGHYENSVSSFCGDEKETIPEKYFYPNHPEEGEKFDPNKSYLGTDNYDYSNMAINYTFCHRVSMLDFGKEIEDRILVSNGRLFSFRFGDEDIFAMHERKSPFRIEKYSKKPKKLFTITEAREEGFFEQKKTDSWPIYFRQSKICDSTESFWVSVKKNDLEITREDFFSNIQRYGAWDAMMVFLDVGAMYGEWPHWPNGISATLWPAITIYSDDYSEVLGVSVLNTQLQFFTYLKEDGYADKITMEQYESGIRKGKADHSQNFGRAAFYFEPNEFVSPGVTAYYNLLGGKVSV